MIGEEYNVGPGQMNSPKLDAGGIVVNGIAIGRIAYRGQIRHCGTVNVCLSLPR